MFGNPKGKKKNSGNKLAETGKEESTCTEQNSPFYIHGWAFQQYNQ
jgi:hypothetical protein